MESAAAIAEPAILDKKSRREDSGQPAMKCEILGRARSASRRGWLLSMDQFVTPLRRDSERGCQRAEPNQAEPNNVDYKATLLDEAIRRRERGADSQRLLFPVAWHRDLGDDPRARRAPQARIQLLLCPTPLVASGLCFGYSSHTSTLFIGGDMPGSRRIVPKSGLPLAFAKKKES